MSMQLKDEYWKPIPMAPGYEASSYGNIRSIDRQVRHPSGGFYLKNGLQLSKYVSTNGYYNTGITISGKTKTIIVPRIVCITFHPNPNNYPIVNHIDGNKLNDRIDNLEWCTYQYNRIHAIQMGLVPKRTVPKHLLDIMIENSSKPVKMVDVVTGNVLTYKKLTDCANVLNVHQSTVSHAIRHRALIAKRYKIEFIPKTQHP